METYLIPQSTHFHDGRISIAPDHKAIRVQLQLENDNRGPGLWKFKNSLLEDEIYVKLITDS